MGGSRYDAGVTRRQFSDDQWELIKPYLPVGEYGPYPVRLREQFEGVIWRFRSGAQWREIPEEFGPSPTVYGRFRVWRDAGVFATLLEGLIAEAARRGKTDLSPASVDSTTARAHHDAAGMRIDPEVMEALEEAVREQEQARQKGAAQGNRTDRTPKTTPAGRNGDASGADAEPA